MQTVLFAILKPVARATHTYNTQTVLAAYHLLAHVSSKVMVRGKGMKVKPFYLCVIA